MRNPIKLLVLVLVINLGGWSLVLAAGYGIWALMG